MLLCARRRLLLSVVEQQGRGRLGVVGGVRRTSRSQSVAELGRDESRRRSLVPLSAVRRVDLCLVVSVRVWPPGHQKHFAPGQWVLGARAAVGGSSRGRLLGARRTQCHAPLRVGIPGRTLGGICRCSMPREHPVNRASDRSRQPRPALRRMRSPPGCLSLPHRSSPPATSIRRLSCMWLASPRNCFAPCWRLPWPCAFGNI